MKADIAKVLVREYLHRLLNEKDLSMCDELLSPDYIDHDTPPDTPLGINFIGWQNAQEYQIPFRDIFLCRTLMRNGELILRDVLQNALRPSRESGP